MNTQAQTTHTPRYIAASIPAWREQARSAIKQGQGENLFLAHCHPLNRRNALAAFRMEVAAIAKAVQ